VIVRAIRSYPSWRFVGIWFLLPTRFGRIWQASGVGVCSQFDAEKPWFPVLGLLRNARPTGVPN
jgi:hypothetical protein